MGLAALVTGASRGIGRGIAIELARAGWDLVVNFRADSAAATETVARCREAGGPASKFWACQADISEAEGRDSLVRFAREKFPALNLLVNNAGVAPAERADLLEASEASFDRLISINAKGPYFLTQQVAKWMVEARRSEEGRDSFFAIVTIGSISAYTASVNRGDYCVSKAALAMLTPLFAVRLASERIGVFEVRPGVIETDMTAGVHDKYQKAIDAGLTPLARWGQPEDVGRAVAAIASGSFPFSTGEVLNVDGGWHLRRL